MPNDIATEQAPDTRPSSLPGTNALPVIDKVVVAIHGVGDQHHSDTIRAAARRFGARNIPPLPVLPLGFFNIGSVGEVGVSRLEVPKSDALARVGFAEVYWADVPREVAQRNDTLEESKSWGETIAGRARALYEGVESDARASQRKPALMPADFSMAAGVIDEIVESVGVMENLLFLTAKAGIFKFDLAPLLRDYIGDVQLVAEFQFYRQVIVYRFHLAMEAILKRVKDEDPTFSGDPEIHVVAHSEGTVIAFLAMLQALTYAQISDPDPDPDLRPKTVSTEWIKSVRGFMTIGSPIDKHILLWPRIFNMTGPNSADFGSRLEADRIRIERQLRPAPLSLPTPIKWRNYYDYGDPIGFELDTARDYLNETGYANSFEFRKDTDDFGFSRYWLPGKAHTDYWNDDQVFGNFIGNVVLPKGGKYQPTGQKGAPQSSRFKGFVSTAIPYALTFLMHMLAVFVLFKAVLATLDLHRTAAGVINLQAAIPGLADAGQAIPVLVDLGKTAYPRVTASVLVLSLLLMGVTVAGRLPRLVKRRDARWSVLALVIFICCASPTLLFLPNGVAEYLDGSVLTVFSLKQDPGAPSGKVVLIVFAALIALTGWVAPPKPRVGRRVLVGAGSALLAVAIVLRTIHAPQSTAIWPLALAALIFLYLWLLAVMLFDLSFIWHRYVRNSVSLHALRAWRRKEDMPLAKLW